VYNEHVGKTGNLWRPSSTFPSAFTLNKVSTRSLHITLSLYAIMFHLSERIRYWGVCGALVESTPFVQGVMG